MRRCVRIWSGAEGNSDFEKGSIDLSAGHGNGAGGVGSILIQLARRLTGLRVVATASRPETIAWVRSLGAHESIDHHKPLDEELRRIGIEQAEYVAGLTATDRHLDAIAKLIAPQGVLALIDDPKTLDIVPFKRKAVTVAWELMFTRSLFHTPDMARQGMILNEIAALVDAGVLRSTVTQDVRSLTAVNLRRAHAIVENGSAYGKTVQRTRSTRPVWASPVRSAAGACRPRY